MCKIKYSMNYNSNTDCVSYFIYKLTLAPTMLEIFQIHYWLQIIFDVITLYNCPCTNRIDVHICTSVRAVVLSRPPKHTNQNSAFFLPVWEENQRTENVIRGHTWPSLYDIKPNKQRHVWGCLNLQRNYLECFCRASCRTGRFCPAVNVLTAQLGPC